MRTEQLLLIIAGLAGIAAFFFPFIHFPDITILGAELRDMTISGHGLIMGILDRFDLVQSASGSHIIGNILDLWQSSTSIQQYLVFIGIMLFVIGPLIFLLYCLGYLFRGLRGKSYKRGIFTALLYMGLGWLAFYLAGSEDGLALNFFNQVGIGFWIAWGAVVLAALSVFFEKNTSKAKIQFGK